MCGRPLEDHGRHSQPSRGSGPGDAVRLGKYPAVKRRLPSRVEASIAACQRSPRSRAPFTAALALDGVGVRVRGGRRGFTRRKGAGPPGSRADCSALPPVHRPGFMQRLERDEQSRPAEICWMVSVALRIHLVIVAAARDLVELCGNSPVRRFPYCRKYSKVLGHLACVVFLFSAELDPTTLHAILRHMRRADPLSLFVGGSPIRRVRIGNSCCSG